ncbi:MAG TPA: helix-turn-helix transcriptional regulator [Solirubrobacteraceae bacterium]|nr:helix-turn-helix transcriptional regulator [Solirubrobacteraceae bacterium]
MSAVRTTVDGRMLGDADVAALASVLSEPARARVLLALADGRALPASVLAAEAGVAPSTMSGHLARLLHAGLVRVEPQGRHRYYRLAGPDVGELIEALARLSPPAPVRSLRQGTRAQQLRSARTCYDHLAGGLGVALFSALLERGLVRGGDGRHDPARAVEDRLSARGRDIDYRLTDSGRRTLATLGVRLPASDRVRYCVDWSEQDHHLSGELGSALTQRLFELGWIRRARTHRAVSVSDAGRSGLLESLGVRVR